MAPKDNERQTKLEEEGYTFSWAWPIGMLAIICATFYGVYTFDKQFPEVITEEQAIKDVTLFSGERSKAFLAKLTKMGPRIVGTEQNDVLAPNIIINQLEQMQNGSHPIQSLIYTTQRDSGVYTLEYKPRFTNIYINIQNIIAKLEGTNPEHSILINCHYDSVPTSDGASDDGISCAVMVELIKVLSQSPVRLKHNLVFLFNGAEETALQGSHMFLKHEWAQDCRVFINMEAGGLGGKAMLFQAGPNNAWLFNYYARTAPHPHGQIIAEELFQSGIVPSDTDFRIFRDFGNIPGLDFAFYSNGYVYHTIYDKEHYLQEGSFQHLGDNILALLNELGYAQEIEHMEEHHDNHTVYFDYLGLKMISYPEELGSKINYGVFALSVISIFIFVGRLSDWTCYGQSAEQDLTFALVEMTFAITARLGGTLFGFLLTVGIGYLLDAVAVLAMPWYSNSWLVFPLFWCPTLVGCGIVSILVNNCREDNRLLPINEVAMMNVVAAQIPFALIMIVLTYYGYRSSAVFMLSVLTSAVANIIIQLTPLYKTAHTWVWFYLIVHIPALLYQMSIVLFFYVFYIPVLGRSSTVNGDVRMAILSAILTLYLSTFAIPLITLVRRPSVAWLLMLFITIVSFAMCLFTSQGMPYQGGPVDPAPQRYWIMHSDRRFYNESGLLRRHETGYFVLNMDRNSPRTIPLHNRTISYLADDCATEMYCGLPLYLGRMVPWSAASSWIPAGAPLLPNPVTMKMNQTCTKSPVVCSLDFVINGPDRLTVTFAPREGVTVKGWNLDTEPKASGEWKGRPAYLMHIVRDNDTSDFIFNLDLNVPSEKTYPILDFGVAGNHVHHEDRRTFEFKTFLSDFPIWTQMTGWISSYAAYVF